MEISVVAVAELRLVTFSQIGVALQTREMLCKLGAVFHHQFSRPLSPKLPFPAEMIHFGQQMNFPLSFYNSTPQWSSSFFPFPNFLLLLSGQPDTSPIFLVYWIGRRVLFFFKPTASPTIYLLEWRIKKGQTFASEVLNNPWPKPVCAHSYTHTICSTSLVSYLLPCYISKVKTLLSVQ